MTWRGMLMFSERTRCLVLTACLAMLLSACGVPEQRPSGVHAGPDRQPGAPEQWALEDGRLMPLDRDQSRLLIYVYRGGRLARLGHNHVLEVTGLRGRLKHLESGGGLAELAFGVDTIVVDGQEARAQAGKDFAQQPDEAAIAGTRQNMRGERVMDAENWPEVRIQARVGNLSAPAPVAEVYVNVRGVSRRYEIPVETEMREAEARVSGSLTVRQSDFGIQSFSVLGGALLVRDEIQANFLVVGRKSGTTM